MRMEFVEKKSLPEKVSQNVMMALSKPLKRFRERIEQVKVNVKDFDLDKPSAKKTLQVSILFKNGKHLVMEKAHESLLEASAKMVKSIKNNMSKVVNMAPLRKRQRQRMAVSSMDMADDVMS